MYSLDHLIVEVVSNRPERTVRVLLIVIWFSLVFSPGGAQA